jgi:NAD(P)-dependent dehydrogenase (short-subunit alcohol dehydrogenase family)
MTQAEGLRTAIVTGAAGTLGRAVVARLAEDGWAVVAVDIAPDENLPDAAYRLGGVDLVDEETARSALADLASRLPGSVTALVNVAGGFAWETVLDGEAATWERLYAINVATALNASKAVAPMLRAGGAIVNIGAAAAAQAGLGMGAYAASKSAVARLTEALAAELRPIGIRVNAVLPSIIDTPANRADMPDEDFAKWVTPAEIAEAILFLISDRASGITGAAIPVTGRV